MSFKKIDATFCVLITLTCSCFFYKDNLLFSNPFLNLQIIQWLQLSLILILSAKSLPEPKLWLIIVCYISSRVILFQSGPVLEDDYYRYLWDGNLVSKGINPYLYPPSDSFWINIPSKWRQFINFPEIRTIYPPLTQFYFAFIYKLFGESVFGLRIGALIIEILLSVSLTKFLKKENLNYKPLALFLFFPTLLKENVNSVHFDLLATLFLFMCFVNLKKMNTSILSTLTTWGALASAVLVKLFPLLLLPVVFFTAQRKALGLSFFILFIIIFYLPFIDAGFQLFSGSHAFAQNWLFFESFPFYVQKFYEFIFQFFNFSDTASLSIITDGLLTRLTLGISLFLIALWVGFSKKITLENKFVVLLLFLYTFSTVVNSWYWLWILPFLIFYGPRISWALPVITTLGYSWFTDQKLYITLHQPAYGLITFFVIIYILKNNYTGINRWKKSGLTP